MVALDRAATIMKLHIFATAASIDPLLAWLGERCGIPAHAIACAIYRPGEEAALRARLPAVTLIAVNALKDEIARDDAIIVAGEDVADKLGLLFGMGFHHVYDSTAAATLGDPVERLATAARETFVGRVPPARFDPAARDALRFTRDPIRAAEIAPHLLFLVNSLPKSGSMWLAGMLAQAMRLPSSDQMVVSHVADIDADAGKWNVHGAVLLLRDMRDVVVSWFHDVRRNDLRSGFARPRYADIETFYRELFLGTMRASERYYRGDLLYWIDRACAAYVPLIRYEDLLGDPAAALERVLNAWRVDYRPQDIAAACAAWSADHLRRQPPVGDDEVSRMFGVGHLRRGVSGGWRDELPPAIADDIAIRFRAYQERLGYAGPGAFSTGA